MNKINKLEIIKKLKSDFPYFASKCLKIIPEESGIIPLNLTKYQLFVYNKLQEQLKTKGKIRAIILKARKHYISTLIEAYIYHQVIFNHGKRAYVFAHRQDAAEYIFEMVKRFYNHSPEFIQPHKQKSNAKELVFDLLDSSYKIGYATAEGIGRGDTVHYFHWSETAFSKNATEHVKGVMQAVGKVPGSQIILESTAKGMTGTGAYFYQMWQSAVRGESEYMPIFLPFSDKEDNREHVPDDFKPTKEESDLIRLYNLDYEQIFWRRQKIVELGSIQEFHQEYPLTATEAFQSSSDDSFIKLDLIIDATKTNNLEKYGSKILGVDPAHMGKDRTALIRRQGRVAYGLEVYKKIDNMEVVGIIYRIIKDEKIDKVFVDASSPGIIDRLREMGFDRQVMPVHFGGEALNKNKYSNKRSEMWGEMKNWLEDKPVSIPNNEQLIEDLSAPQIQFPDSNSRVVLESKKSMLSRNCKSPDCGDALALTFAFPSVKNTNLINKIYNPSLQIR